MSIERWLAMTGAAVIAAPCVLAQEPTPGTVMQRDPADPAGIRTTPLQLRSESVTSGTAFNPAMSVILDGLYRNTFSGHAESPAGFGDVDHSHDHDHGDATDGLALRETEVTFTAAIDVYFDALVMLAIEGDSGVEVEEAYLTTRSLPAGLQLKFGRFLSDIGYINKQHLHQWDFADRPLVNEFLFGDHGLQDNGVQLSWVPPTPFYVRLGTELLQGSSGVAAYQGAGRHEIVTMLSDNGVPQRMRWRADDGLRDRSGPRLATAFAKFAPNLDFDHEAQFGFSYGRARAWQASEAHSSGRLETWDGDAWFMGTDVVYKYDAGRSFGHGDWVFQAEYFYREIDVDYASRVFADTSTLVPTVSGEAADLFSGRSRQDGFYAQIRHGVAPRWQLGLRAEALGLTNDSLEADRGANRFESFGTSYRYAGNVTFRPTEFSAIRAQINYDDFATADGNGHDHGGWTFLLQFNMSMGVHGAHQF